MVYEDVLIGKESPMNKRHDTSGGLTKARFLAIQKKIERYGFTFLSHTGRGEETRHLYTIGLCDRGLPEILIMGNIAPHAAERICNLLISHWQRVGYVQMGELTQFLKFENGMSASIKVVPIDTTVADAEYTGEIDNHFPYIEHRVVQLLWPDPNGYLPDDERYNVAQFPQLRMPRPMRVVNNQKEFPCMS